MSIRHLDRLLEPRSVVVIGASSRPGSVGATAIVMFILGLVVFGAP